MTSHDDRTERPYYSRDRRYDSRYDSRYDRRRDDRRYDSRYLDRRGDRAYDREDRYRSDYRHSGYSRRDYGRSSGGGSYPVRRENPPMTREMLERRVYCHNLSYRSSWQDLKDYMRAAGDVEYVRVMEDSEGRSRGCAVVMFTTKEGAKKAIKTLNDTTFAGRSIFVREDRAYSERKGSKDSHGRDSDSSSSRSDSRDHHHSHRRGDKDDHDHRSRRSRHRSRSGSRSASGEDDRSGRYKDRIAEGDRYSDDNEKSPIEEDRRDRLDKDDDRDD